jgi:hypothetical protein
MQITTKPTFNATRPSLLFAEPFAQTASRYNHDISPDGEHFVMLKPGEHEDKANQINVVLNWYGELNKRVPLH